MILLHPISYRAAEFVFTFEFAGNLEEYCLYTELMDNLVMSLRWGENKDASAKTCIEISCQGPPKKMSGFLE